MADHLWVADSTTATEYRFRCTSECRQVIGFAKPGQGEPHAEDANTPPANINDYAGECVALLPTVLTKRQFLNRLTMSEKAGIRTAAKSNVTLETVMWEFELALEVPLDHPDTIATVGYLVQLGLLTQERATTILTP